MSKTMDDENEKRLSKYYPIDRSFYCALSPVPCTKCPKAKECWIKWVYLRQLYIAHCIEQEKKKHD